MKKLGKFFLFFLFSTFTMGCAQSDPIFYDVQERKIKTSHLRGHWVIVNYWASWCHGCVEEMPELNRFYQKNKDKNVLFFGVNYDQLSADALKEAINKVNIQFPVLTEDPNSSWHLGDVDVIPVIFIINPQGQVVKKIVGPSTEQSLSATLDSLKNNSK